MIRAVLAIYLLSASQIALANTQSNWPKTCVDAVDMLLKDLPIEEKEKLAKFKEGELFLLHHGFGTNIRNDFGLWNGNLALIKDCSGKQNTHPDDVSMSIIQRLWERLQH
ncbi:DUF6794 domain-containing protein [uncultured Roseovarius sp.]|uniref:DUF6794 domain-containing protein n=1 Tax=uncultured Roseovarius sp. TaxID=293344 RepID=UPI002635E37B|nr:DUF6794 domain-containing protein [uncultured Roseovarius sp.]